MRHTGLARQISALFKLKQLSADYPLLFFYEMFFKGFKISFFLVTIDDIYEHQHGGTGTIVVTVES
jgi:hypothetical protein